MKIGIIADDLIGANNAAAPFQQRGLSTQVWFEWAGTEPELAAELDVLALDSGTRHADPAQAAEGVRQAGLFLNRCNNNTAPTVLFKTVDSTLRGQVGAELTALLALYPDRMAIVAPALPEYGRTVDLSRVLLNGQPVEETEIGSRVTELLKLDNTYRVGQVNLGQVRGGSATLLNSFQEFAGNDIRIAICDSLNQADLEVIAHVALKQPERYILVGSAGLARALTNHLGPHGDGAAPVLVVGGSLQPQALYQNQYLLFHWSIRQVELDLDWVLHGGEGARFSEVARCLQEIQVGLTEGLDTLLVPRPVAERPGRTPDSPGEVAQIVGDTLGEIVAVVLSVQATRQFPLAGLILVGGATTDRVCRKLEAHGLQPQAEVLPGISAARLQGGPYADTPLVTKPGNLGPDNALTECARYLKRGLA